MNFNGTTGDDSLTGTSGHDVFYLGQGGNDTVDGGASADVFKFGAAFGSGDHVDGGTGIDTLSLNGDYATQLFVGASELVNVEKIVLGAGHQYNFAFADGVIAHGQSLTVKADALAVGDAVTIDAGSMTSAYADTKFIVYGGAGSTFFTAGGGTNLFHGGSGADFVYFGDNFGKDDRIDGGAGIDALSLNGDYTAGLTFSPVMLKNVESIVLNAGFSYKLTTGDANVAAGQTLTVFAGTLDAPDRVVFNGSHETDGRFEFHGGAGDDVVQGGALNDFFYGTAGGNDRFTGNSGGDLFHMGGALNAADRIDGGNGIDELDLDGDYSAGLVFKATTLHNVEIVSLTEDHSYKFTLNDANVDAGRFVAFFAGNLDGSDSLTLDASAETNANVLVIGGQGDDTFIGGQFQNGIFGGLGQDRMTAGGGTDAFGYNGAAESTGLTRDIVTGFDALHDSFDLPFALAGIDAVVTSGALAAAQFDTDLAAAIGAEQLGIHGAVLFTPDTGDLHGHTFLIVDVNGTAGYQAGQDLVIELVDGCNMGSFGTANFT